MCTLTMDSRGINDAWELAIALTYILFYFCDELAERRDNMRPVVFF